MAFTKHRVSQLLHLACLSSSPNGFMSLHHTSTHFIVPEKLHALLNPTLQKWLIKFTHQTGSTNQDVLNELKSLRNTPHPNPQSIIHITEHQTAGRGRMQRTWLEQPKHAILCTVGIIFNKSIHQLNSLSLVVGLALRHALQNTLDHSDYQIKLKWPNDLLLYKKETLLGKIGGILIETAWHQEQRCAMAIGFGINLELPFCETHDKIPAAAFTQTGSQAPAEIILSHILHELARILPIFEQNGFAAFHESWNQHHAFQQKHVTLMAQNQILAQGTTFGVNAHGQLLLKNHDDLYTFHTGEISLRAQSDSRYALLIDIGNSRIKWAFSNSQKQFIAQGHLTIEASQQSQQLAQMIPQSASMPPPYGIWLSNVCDPKVAEHVQNLLKQAWTNCTITQVKAEKKAFGIHNQYDFPEKLGSDRWAGLIGAKSLFPEHALLIATLGTATTLEMLNQNGQFIGGLIIPGLNLMLNSLSQNTSQLPKLNTTHLQPQTNSSFSATNTQDSILLGCQFSQAALITQAWQTFCQQHQPCKLLLNGGSAKYISSLLSMPHTTLPSLTLIGLAHIAQTTNAA